MATKYLDRTVSGKVGVAAKDLKVQSLAGQYAYAGGKGKAAYALSRELALAGASLTSKKRK